MSREEKKYDALHSASPVPPELAAEGKPVQPEAGQPATAKEEEMLRQAVDVILTVYKAFGFDDTEYSTNDTLKTWVQESRTVGWMKYLKLKTAGFFSAWTGQEIPEFSMKSEPRLLLEGRANRWVRSLHQRQRASSPDSPERRKFDSFLYTILLSKKGMPRASESDLKQAAYKAFTTMTSINPVMTNPFVADTTGLTWAQIEDEPLYETAATIEDMCLEVTRTCEEVFAKEPVFDKKKLQPYAPSFNSNYNRSRSELGGFGHLYTEGLLPGSFARDVQKEGKSKKFVIRPQDAEQQKAVQNAFGAAAADLVMETKQLMSEDKELPVEMFEEGLARRSLTLDAKEIGDQFRQLWQNCLSRAKTERPLTEIVPLAEPLKIRTISKGPAETYFVLKAVQKKMHRAMRKQKTFRLIGAPADAHHIRQHVGRCRRNQHYCSVDYEAATDNLQAVLSEAAARAIARKLQLEPDLETLFIRALTQHEMVNPTDEKDIRPQRRGQLMGSIVSFPILCLVNAAVIRFVKEKESKTRLTLDECQMLINGDDALVKLTPAGYRLWKGVAALAGLKPSVGKVYFSKEFLVVNSEMFYVTEHQTLESVKYINLGLAYGRGRSVSLVGKANAEKTEEKSLGTRHHELMKRCPDGMEEVVHEIFLRHNSRVLEAATKRGLPWYVPEGFGGVGLAELATWTEEKLEDGGVRRVRVPHKRYRMTRMDRIGCRMIALGLVPTPIRFSPENVVDLHGAACDAFGLELERRVRLRAAPSHWADVQYVNKERHADDASQANFFAWMYHYTWMFLPQRVHSPDKIGRDTLKWNERVWRKVAKRMKSGKAVPPFETVMDAKPVVVGTDFFVLHGTDSSLQSGEIVELGHLWE